MEEIVLKVPPPKGDSEKPLTALIFDSHYDSYKGVVAYVRVVEGTIRSTDTLRLMQTKTEVKPIEVGVFSPTMKVTNTLAAGEVGYIATGLKTVSECHVGDTVTSALRSGV